MSAFPRNIDVATSGETQTSQPSPTFIQRPPIASSTGPPVPLFGSPMAHIFRRPLACALFFSSYALTEAKNRPPRPDSTGLTTTYQPTLSVTVRTLCQIARYNSIDLHSVSPVSDILRCIVPLLPYSLINLQVRLARLRPLSTVVSSVLRGLSKRINKRISVCSNFCLFILSGIFHRIMSILVIVFSLLEFRRRFRTAMLHALLHVAPP